MHFTLLLFTLSILPIFSLCSTGSILFEPGLNYFRICCSVKSISAFIFDEENNPRILFSHRLISDFQNDRTEFDSDGHILLIPLIPQNGFHLYKWYLICAHFTDSSSTFCSIIRPCNCDCYSKSWMTIGFSAETVDKNVTGLNAKLLESAEGSGFPGQLQIDISLFDAQCLSNSTPFSRFSLATGENRDNRSSFTLPLTNDAPDLIHIKANATLTNQNLSIFSDLLVEKVFYAQDPFPLTDINLIEWNKGDYRFWVIQPIRFTTVRFIRPSEDMENLKFLNSTETREMCLKWGNQTLWKVLKNSGAKGNTGLGFLIIIFVYSFYLALFY